jgi:putative phosphoribosyl transferase
MTMDQIHNALPVSVGEHGLQGFLDVPENATGLVIFAHGSGSGRHSPRNNYVAAGLRRSGLATLLIDLLNPSEEADRRNVFDIPLLASRLREAADWVASAPALQGLPIGYFGASTGAGAALLAASQPDDRAAAVVSRGGRPDLAREAALARVRAPTLLIVGSLDDPVIELNKEAMRQMRTETQMVIVPGASHLFEEPGTLDEVIGHAGRWFRLHLRGVHP